MIMHFHTIANDLCFQHHVFPVGRKLLEGVPQEGFVGSPRHFRRWHSVWDDHVPVKELADGRSSGRDFGSGL